VGPDITAIVFDLGGVLIDWDFRDLYRKLLPSEDEVEWFLSTVCTPEWHSHHDRGRPMAEGVAELVARFPEYETLIRAWDQRFTETWRGPITETVEILAELKSRALPLYALTNWPAEKFPLARRMFQFIDWFDGVVVSGEVGMVKPEPGIFELLCERYGLTPARTLFIDDVQGHVEAARALGFRALRFRSPRQLRVELAGLGLL
jgi:2-haloacid dehalogenase